MDKDQVLKELKEIKDELKELFDNLYMSKEIYQPGDGFCVLNETTSGVAIIDCLIGKTKKNKLTEDEHSRKCI